MTIFDDKMELDGRGIEILHQFKKYLKDLNRDVKEVGRVKQKEIKSGLDGEETVEFDVITLSNSAVIKANYRVQDGGGDGGFKLSRGGGAKNAVFTLDLNGVQNEQEARKAFEIFQDIVIGFDLKNHPAHEPLKYYTGGGGKWHDLGNQIKKEKLQEYAKQFQEKGIKVYLNDELIVGAKPKPWDVPRGAPKLKRE